jgi:hypothetical protein
MKKVMLILALVSTSAFAAADRVAQYDFDKDGKVSFNDVNRYCTVSKSLFERADKNGDGYLSNAEMSAARRYIFSRCSEFNQA